MCAWNVRNLRKTIVALALLAGMLASGAVPAMAQYRWTGTWEVGDTVMRIVRDGSRVYGDYGARGVIEGRTSTDGRYLRAAMQTGDNAWGFVELDQRAAGRIFIGNFAYRDFPDITDLVWEGAMLMGVRVDTATPGLQSARANETNYPLGLDRTPHPLVLAWLDFSGPIPDTRLLASASAPDPSVIPGGIWQGDWSIGDETYTLAQSGDRVFGVRYGIGSTTLLEGRLSESGRSLRGVLTTQVVQPGPSGDGRIDYFDALMNGDNYSFVGETGSAPDALTALFDGTKQEGEGTSLSAGRSHFPPSWNAEPPAEVAGWLAFGEPAGALTRHAGLAGTWQVEATGTALGPFSGPATIRLGAPDAAGITLGEISGDGGTARLYGATPETGEFRGLFLVMDRTGNNPNGQWGTIRLLGNAANGQFSGSWAFSYRLPLPNTRQGVPGGRITAQLTDAAIPAGDFSATGIERNLSYLNGNLAMPVFSPARPEGEVLAAMEAWWHDRGELCDADCTAPHPTVLSLDATDLYYSTGSGVLDRPRAMEIYGYVRAIVMFRDERGQIARAGNTPAWVDLWRVSRNDAADIVAQGSGPLTGDFLAQPPRAPRSPQRLCSVARSLSGTAGSAFPPGARTLTVTIPELFLLSANVEIIVNVETDLAIARSLRADLAIGGDRLTHDLLDFIATAPEPDRRCVDHWSLLGDGDLNNRGEVIVRSEFRP